MANTSVSILCPKYFIYMQVLAICRSHKRHFDTMLSATQLFQKYSKCVNKGPNIIHLHHYFKRPLDAQINIARLNCFLQIC